MVPKNTLLKPRSPSALTVKPVTWSQMERRDRHGSEWHQRQIFTPRLHPSQADPEHRPHAAVSAGRGRSPGQGSCGQVGWLCLPHSAAGTSEPISSVLQRTQVSLRLCAFLLSHRTWLGSSLTCNGFIQAPLAALLLFFSLLVLLRSLTECPAALHVGQAPLEGLL